MNSPRLDSTDQRRWLILAVIGVLIGVLFAIATYVNGPRIVARAVSPDGVEMCIIQRCNWSPELFTTSFWYRKPGKPWGWFYYDHQDGYWSKGTVSLNTDQTTAVFFRNGKPTVTFDWAAERYTLHRIDRTLTGAQNWAPLGAPLPY